MQPFLERNNWESFVFERLNALIEVHRKDITTDFSEKNYVVFDFDDTSILGDVEDNLMFYMVENLLYRLNPQEFEAITKTPSYPLNIVVDLSRPELTLFNLAEDICQAYQIIWQDYIQKEAYHRPDLEQYKRRPVYQSFRAKLIYFYQAFNQMYTIKNNVIWPTYWFSGYHQEELQALSRDMMTYMFQSSLKNYKYVSHPSMKGLTGPVESEFATGMRFSEELVNLYEVFKQHGIVPYIVSASPIDIVRVAGHEYHFQLPLDQIYGMEYIYDEEGRATARIKKDSIVTVKAGKTATILEQIAHRHQGKQPIAIFGDSNGDYNMMVDLDQVQLALIFNLLRQGKIQDLVEQAVASYGQEAAKYLVQGRDNNHLSLINSTGTIGLGRKNSKIFAK